jgi:hypothetical protein
MVDHPGEGSGVVEHREDGRVAAREPDELLADVVGVGGDTLLVEEVRLDPVRIPHHVERAAAEVREGTVRDVDVVPDEVTLGQSALGEEDLVRVRDRDLAAADSHGQEVSAW